MIYFYNRASTFNITILINLAPKQTAGAQTAGAQKPYTPKTLHLSAEISDDHFSHLHQNDYYLLSKISQWRV